MAIESCDLETKINQQLKGATPEQVKWVFARITCNSDKDAAKKVGVGASSVCRWENKSQLDEAVRLLLIDPLLAAAETLRIAAPDAAAVLVAELKGKQKRQAANDVLDRAGVSRLTKVAPTTPDGKEGYRPLDLENLTDAELERLGKILTKIAT